MSQVYIIDGARTPFLKARGERNPFSASDLAVAAGKSLLLRQPFAPSDIGEVILGCVMPSEDEANIARVVSLRLGCGKDVPAWTVQRNCGSGMQAIDCAFQDIVTGRHELVLVGGTEAMSRAPLLLNPQLVDWLAQWRKTKGLKQQLKCLAQLRPRFLKPIIALAHGLSDSVIGMNMGQTAEILAYRFGITREQMDAFSLQSHQRAAAAQAMGLLAMEIAPIFSYNGQLFAQDTGVRANATLDALEKLAPFFDKPFGLVTPGNSSQVSDGAAMLLLANEKIVARYNLPILGRIVDTHWAALQPEQMGLGPVYAATPLLRRHQLTLQDIDYWEINEAFAAQVLSCIKGWENDDFCRKQLGLDAALGTLDQQRLNVDGGAIALGHPVGASGARIVLHLLEVLKRRNAHRGVAALCIGGGQGGAMLLEK